MGLAAEILKGNEKSAARLITQIENGDSGAYSELSELFSRSGSAHIIGVTGPAGAGKSTLVGCLAEELAKRGKGVGVVATDPTSVTGKGAFLGDRLRMKRAEEGRVFIRSMAHRAYPGGVARAAAAAAYIMEGLGKEFIIIESIGAGQSDKDLFFLCDTVVTVFTPEYGDEIQLLKAGLMEIGDIVVVNKSDRPGADDAVREITLASSMHARANGWQVPILSAEAISGSGVPELIDAVEGHKRSLEKHSGTAGRKAEHLEAFMTALLKDELWHRVSDRVKDSDIFRNASRDVLAGRTDPYSAVRTILDTLEKEWTSH